MDDQSAVVAAYEAALPDDDRVARKKMFGTPCAFVNRQMFFGIFEGSLVARLGRKRVAALAGQPGMRVFTPTEGRPWDDTLQVDLADDAPLHSDLAAEALAWTATLPTNGKKPKFKKAV